MKNKFASIFLLLILISACSTTQNSVTNNNTQTVAQPQNQVPVPVKHSNKYQKYKSGDQPMKAPASMEKVSEKMERVDSVRDTLK
jgi:hypothetical protein